MTLANKALLYSLFVFPGSGYFFIGKKRLAWSILIAVCAGIGVFMVEAYAKAQVIAAKIVYGEIPYSISAIREQIEIVPGVIDPNLLSWLTVGLVILWLAAAVDCHSKAKKLT